MPLMPRYEYQCANGHKDTFTFPTRVSIPVELSARCSVVTHAPSNDDPLDTGLCEEVRKRVYSTFSFHVV